MLYVGVCVSMYMYGRMEGQMYCLSVLACAHMHRTRMCGSMQHDEVWHIVVGDAALTVFQPCPRLYCYCLLWRETVSALQCGLHQPHAHMYSTCRSVLHMRLPTETVLFRNKKCKTNSKWIVLSTRYRDWHQFGCVILASFVWGMGSNLCIYWERWFPWVFTSDVCMHREFLHKEFQGLVFQFSVGDLVKE